MKFFVTKSIAFLLIVSCLACSQKPAQVLNRGKNVYDKKIVKRQEPKAVAAGGEIEVGAGDTLFSISKKYQVVLRDLIKQNNLQPPYELKAGTRLVLPVANYHEVKVGETLYSISRNYNMKINSLIELNNLKEPYAIKVGDKLKIEKLSTNVAATELKPLPAKAQEIKTEAVSSPSVAAISKEEIPDKTSGFSWPIKGSVVSQFGPKKGGLYNDGINIKAKEGAEVRAAKEGVVAYVGNELKGYGNLVIIKHSQGWITAYAHLKSSLVARGQKISKGEKIGLVGASGNVNSPQLYFGLRKGRDAVNPANYLK
jgi:murein DD-endopeptidase MepM/ murein hydrolase activator NlpD